MLVEALGAVFLCGGIALWLEVSYLLAAMVMGVLVANLARHHVRPFHAIEGIEWPFMVLFFVLSGASLHSDSLARVGIVVVAFVGLRILGRLAGAWALVGLGRIDRKLGAWMGLALLPQAGVALGMALVAAQRMPQLGDEILTVVIAATVFFEVVGPVFTRLALLRVGEARVAGED
jgi:Kef-type K+ transport system membrane component KefB